MNDINERIAKLSSQKRALIERYLLEQDRAAAREHTIPRREASDQVPLSFAQQRLWLLDQFEPGSVVYNMPAAFHFEGALDITALKKSLNEIVQRHEGLRTTFSSVDGEPMQIIVPKLHLELQIIDLQELPEAERDDECRNLSALEARRPFDISRGPLFRAGLLRLEQDDHILLLTMHHIISDGWSRGVLYRELSTLYESFCGKEPSSLPDLPIQYADFAVWQRQWLQGEVLAEQLSYWKEQLDGALPVLELPTDRSRPAVQAFRGARYRLHIPLPLVQSLKTLSLQEKTTLYMLLLTGFKILLYRYTAEEDIIVGSPIANRNRSEIEGLIGFFINTLVLRTDLSDDPTVRELLARVREVCYGAYGHQDLPFEKLVEEVHPERSMSHSPLFQVMFVLQNTPRSLPELSGLKVKQLEVDSGTAKFDLTLNLYDEKGGLLGEWEYDTDLYDAETIERMARHYQTILQGIVDDPEQQISDVPLLTNDERHQLLVQWNDTRTDYPRDKCFHELFEEQVNLHPAKIAVEFQGEEISYDELDCRANQLAHYLRDIGVGPNALVGLFVDRSIDMMVGLLAILKAGGAYVPLDPDYPRERLSYMLAESRSPVLITQDKFKNDLPESDAHIVLIDSDWDAHS